MIKITIYRKDINDGAPCYDRTSYICGFLAEGHTRDIAIQTSVSTLTQVLIVGVKQWGCELEYELNEDDGTIIAWIPEVLIKNPGVQLLFNTVEKCLEDIATWYKDDVSVKEEAYGNEQESKI